MTAEGKDGLRRVLLVTREIPPAIGPHPIRVAKLAKYLPDFGWRPTILSVPAEYAWSEDQELLRDLGDVEVIRVPRLLERLAPAGLPAPREPAGVRTDRPGSRRVRSRIAKAILVPDTAIAWAIPAARRCARIAGAYDAVFSTAPPFSTHLVGEHAAICRGVPWVAEYRDNWTMNPLYRRARPLQLINERLERRLLRRAAGVVVVSESAAQELRQAFPWLQAPVSVARNGYDPDDLPPRAGRPVRFEIAYAGSLDERRDPRPFLEALMATAAARPGFLDSLRLRLMGNVAPWVGETAAARLGSERVMVDGLLPHKEALRRAGQAAVLLGITTRNEAGGAGLTSKLFEYLALSRPVLMLAPDGPARDLVIQSGGGVSADPENVGAIANAVSILYEEWSQGRERTVAARFLSGMTRRETARAVAGALDAASRRRNPTETASDAAGPSSTSRVR